jgi:hypothetical protein
MLCHACGAPANKGRDTRAFQACLDHRNIQHTVRYIELSPDRFKDFCAERAMAPRLASLSACAGAPRAHSCGDGLP